MSIISEAQTSFVNISVMFKFIIIFVSVPYGIIVLKQRILLLGIVLTFEPLENSLRIQLSISLLIMKVLHSMKTKARILT